MQRCVEVLCEVGKMLWNALYSALYVLSGVLIILNWHRVCKTNVKLPYRFVCVLAELALLTKYRRD